MIFFWGWPTVSNFENPVLTESKVSVIRAHWGQFGVQYLATLRHVDRWSRTTVLRISGQSALHPDLLHRCSCCFTKPNTCWPPSTIHNLYCQHNVFLHIQISITFCLHHTHLRNFSFFPWVQDHGSSCALIQLPVCRMSSSVQLCIKYWTVCESKLLSVLWWPQIDGEGGVSCIYDQSIRRCFIVLVTIPAQLNCLIRT